MFDSKDTSTEVEPNFTTVSTGLGQPEISILMPVWNCEPFITDALTSILNQTEVVAEILVSDDASTDQTYLLALCAIEEWLKHSKPTHIVRIRKNRIRQRRHHFNQLVRHSTCDIVFEAHGDDISLPGRAAILRDLLNRSDLEAAMVFSEAILIDEKGIILDEPSNQIKPLELALCNPEVFLEENTSLIGASMAWKKSSLSKFSVPEEVMAAAAPAIVAPGIFPRLTALVAHIKTHKNYTDAIGADLQIVGAEQVVDMTVLKPVITATLDAGGVIIGWVKQGMDGIEIWVDRGDGKGFAFLTIDTVPDYTDTQPLPTGASALWKYKAIYRLGDERTGQWSDVVSIAVAG